MFTRQTTPLPSLTLWVERRSPTMNLDLLTLMWVMLLASLTLAFSVLVVEWRAEEHDGLSSWGLALAVHAASYPFFAYRLYGSLFISVLGTTLANSSAMALFALAVRRFQHGRGPTAPPAVLWTPVGVAILLSLATFESNHWRTVSNTCVLCAQAGLIGWMSWAPGLQGSRERGRILLTAGAAILIVTFVARTLQAAVGSNWNAPMRIGVPEALQAQTYFVTLGVLLLMTMGYVLMQKEYAMGVLHEQATRDPLTGIANRRVVINHLSKALSFKGRPGQALSLLMFDIDRFKQVNDTYGHHAGDLVLTSVVAQVSRRLRTTDLLGRIGGEEFVAVLHNTTADGARALAEELRRAVAATPILVDDHEIRATVSIGVFCAASDTRIVDFREVMALCDRALYAAKRNGRNRVEYAHAIAS